MTTGDMTINELDMSSLGMKECLEAVRDGSDWKKKFRKLPEGRGIAARTQTQAPEVDGIVLVDADPAGIKAGDPFLEVEIIGADTYDLKGRIAL